MEHVMEPPLDITALVKRKLIHDITPQGGASDLMKSMGLVPGSEEGDLLERRASQLRLNQMRPIDHMVATLGALSGEVIGRCILEHQELEPDEATLMQYSLVSTAVAKAVVANLLDLGILHLGGHL
jgi:hypothetical protein